jgi:predicted ATPase
VHNAFERGLQLAEQFGDARHLLPQLVGLHILYIRVGDHPGSLAIAQRGMTIARVSQDPLSIAVANGMLGHSEYELGDLISAQTHLEAALARLPVHGRGNHVPFGLDQRIRCLLVLMRTLWLRGRADQAFVVAKQTLAEAEAIDHPVSLCISLLHTGMAFLGLGDWTNAEVIIEREIAYAARYSLVLYEAVGRGFKSALSLRRGDTAGGTEPLRQCLALLRAERHRLFTPVLSAYFAEGLAAAGRFEEALAFIDDAIAEDAGQTHYTAEMWRVRGQVLALAPGDRSAEAEAWLMRAIDKAREQSALSLELRAATRLAQLRRDQGRSADGRALLQPVYDRFTEGFGTADLKTARALLLDLR